jgi:tetratricopeptide (TPR) repeat protein
MHGMVDFPFEAPVFTIAVLLILALVENANPKQPKLALSSDQAILILTIGITVFGVTSGWQIRGSRLFTAGLTEFEAGNWKPASEKICEMSAHRESDSFYAFQCALALSVRADRSNDPSQLQEALEKYNAGINRDPFWPVHIANQAAIEFQLGNANGALRGMSTALHQAPRNARFALNLGVMYEAVGNEEAAQNAYAHAIELDPWIYRSAFMNLTELRRSVIHRIEQVTFLNEVQAKTWQGWILLDQGRTSSAIEAFTQVLLLNPIVGEAHAGLAIALHRSEMDPEAIAEELRHAAFYAPGSSLVQEAIGSIALQESQPDAAALTFERMFQILSHPNDSREYYASTYNRPSLPFDTVPQLQPNPVPPEILDHLRWLADYYEDTGDTDRAEEVRDWVLAQVDG